MRSHSDAILHAAQQAYLDDLAPVSDALVEEMDRSGRAAGVPIVDREVGRLLELLVRMHKPRRVLEVGTAIGFSGLFILRGLPQGGHLTTIDVDPERLKLAGGFFDADGHAGRYSMVCKPALEAVPELEGPWDMLFLDGLKVDYQPCVELALPKMPSGALIVCDNLLWSGQAAGENLKPEEAESTAAIRGFNSWFTQHPELLSMITPVGDGTGMALKK